MKIIEVSVNKTQKIQIAQYEPVAFSYGMKAEIDKGEDPTKVKEELEGYVDQWLAWEVKKWKDTKGAIKDIRNKEVPF